jgi:protein phosphatase 2C family protein 2/3
VFLLLVLKGNVGDSRAVASVHGISEDLSLDHKPTGEREHSRITRAGGYVEYSRVNGNLALSRALGDYGYKTNTKLQPEEQVVTANPDVEVRKLSNEYEFILIACDGIWDVLTSQVSRLLYSLNIKIVNRSHT